MRQDNVYAMATSSRIPNVLSSEGHRAGVERAENVAETLSKRNIYKAKAALMHVALIRLVSLCYERFEGSSVPANVDRDGRILVPVPWSRSSYKRYGLRRTEADSLRWEVMGRSLPENVTPPLFVYVEDLRSWYIDLRAYPTEIDAMDYVERYPITWESIVGYQRAKA